MSVSPIPEGYHSVTPYLYMADAAAAIEYYVRAFEAVELFRLPDADGKVMHAEIQIGNSKIMLADEYPEMGVRGPSSIGGSASSLMIYVPDVDRLFAQAIAAGGKEVRGVQNQFYGDRSGTLIDPFGHNWTIATHVEDVSPEEIDRRFSAYLAEQGS